MRPRLAVVLLLLTAVVSLFGWRFARGTSARQADGLTRAACSLYAEWRARPSTLPAVDNDAAANRAAALVGRKILLPGGAGFAYSGTTSERAPGAGQGAAVRFTLDGDPFLLFVARGGGSAPASSPFPGASFLSGERQGVSFVLWKRDGLFWCLVSDRDMTRVFEVVRRHFP
jgi:hypothetical protein